MGQRLVGAYKRGEEISRIAQTEGISLPTANNLIYSLLKEHPELKTQRKEAKQRVNQVTKK